MELQQQQLDEDQGQPAVIKHGLQYGELPETVKRALVARGVGEPLTNTLKSLIPKEGLTAFPCLVVNPTTGDIEGSLWALRGGISWKAGYKARTVWGKAVPKEYDLVLDIPNDSINFRGDSAHKNLSEWQDAFDMGWATVTGPDGRALEDIGDIPGVAR